MNQPYLISRRNALKSAGALALAVSALEMAGPLAWAPRRAAPPPRYRISSSTSPRC